MIYTLEWYDRDSIKWRVQTHGTSREKVLSELYYLKKDGVDFKKGIWRLGIYDLISSEPIAVPVGEKTP